MSRQKITKVVVVGAGISGVVAASHLLECGLQVTVFERSSGSGGIWRYDTRPAREPAYPSETPSVGDYVPREKGKPSCDTEDEGYSSDIEILHAPPGPCYAGLKTIFPAAFTQTTLLAWPKDTGEHLDHQQMEDYIIELSRSNGVDLITRYNTRVEEVRKSGTAWTVRTSNLAMTGAGGRRQLLDKDWEFDAVVMASGHYNAPRIPDIEGLEQWKERWPDRVQHSKGYRKPDVYKGQNVLLVGAGVSSTDVARELGSVAAAVYQSSRGGELDLPSTMLPPNAVRIGGIAKFELSSDRTPTQHEKTSSEPISGTVLLANGSKLCHIHQVILCTGYMTSYSFLKQYHSDTLPAEQATPNVLVTAEGSQLHNLHKDIFYIPDPTLAFIGTTYHVATFSFFEFQAMALARVFAGTCQLPSEPEMRAEYDAKKQRKGLGRDFHSLRGTGEEEAYVTELVEWVNRDAVARGLEPTMKGHTDEWRAANKAKEEIVRRFIGRTCKPDQSGQDTVGAASWTELC